MNTDMIRRMNQIDNRLARLEAIDALSIAARYTANSGTLGASGYTTINFATADYDPLSLVTPGASWVFTAPIAGYYAIKAMIAVSPSDSVAAGTLFYMEVRVDTSRYCMIDYFQTKAASAYDFSLRGCDVIEVDKDSEVDVRISNGHTSAINLIGNHDHNHIAIYHIAQGI